MRGMHAWRNVSCMQEHNSGSRHDGIRAAGGGNVQRERRAGGGVLSEEWRVRDILQTGWAAVAQ